MWLTAAEVESLFVNLIADVDDPYHVQVQFRLL